MSVRGRVVERQKILYAVDTDAGTIEAEVRGTLKRKDARPHVGDIVSLEMVDREQSRGLITTVEPRTNLLKRPAIANVQRVLLITTTARPRVDTTTVDRFLVNVGVLSLETVLVFNKLDVLSAEQRSRQEETRDIYRQAGYAAISVSATQKIGIPELTGFCQGTVSTMAGVSGVGKSTLLNVIVPGRNLPTAEVSRKTEQGLHTTSTTVLLKLGPDSYVADTPGFASIDLPDIDSRDVGLYYPEIAAMVGACRFNNCLHQDEPGCAVKRLVEEGTMAASRYRSYLLFTSELMVREKRSPEARNE